VGYQAGYGRTTGVSVTALGYRAGYSGTTATRTTMIGDNAGYNTTGSDNTFVGQNSGNTVTSGYSNTILGRYNGNQGGLDIRTDHNYIVLSDGDGNPRLYCDNSGNWELGTFSNSGASDGIEWTPTSYKKSSRSSTATRTHWDIYNPNGLIGAVSTNGSTTTYATSSDYRLKGTGSPVTGALSRCNQLNPMRNHFLNDPTKELDMFLAHEVQAIVPEAVTGEKDAIDDEGNPIYQGIDQSKLVPLMVAAIQELTAEVESLKAQLNP